MRHSQHYRQRYSEHQCLLCLLASRYPVDLRLPASLAALPLPPPFRLPSSSSLISLPAQFLISAHIFHNLATLLATLEALAHVGRSDVAEWSISYFVISTVIFDLRTIVFCSYSIIRHDFLGKAVLCREFWCSALEDASNSSWSTVKALCS